jgi:drug/metabolite transporter (DMT)-like permease
MKPWASIGGTSIGAISVILWGAALPLIRLACEGSGVLSTLAVAQGLAGVLGTLFMIISGRFPCKRSVYLSRGFALRGMLFVSHILLLYAAVQLVDRSAMPGVIFCNYLWPTLVIVYAFALKNISIARPDVFLVGLTTVLVALFIELGSATLNVSFLGPNGIAFGAAFLGAHAWGLYSAFTRQLGDSSGGSAVTPLFLLTCGSIGLILIPVSAFPSAHIISSGTSGAAIALGVCNFVAYICWDLGMRKGNIITLSLLADCIPWLSLGTMCFMLGVPIQNRTLFSAFLLVCGGVAVRLGAHGR